jgi:hypothetical protein
MEGKRRDEEEQGMRAVGLSYFISFTDDDDSLEVTDTTTSENNKSRTR